MLMESYPINISPTTLLVDGAHMLRRSLYVESLRDLSSSTGVPSGGIYGFINSLLSSKASFSASNLIVCWEGGHSERRKTLYEDYKKRDPDDPKEVKRDIHGMTDYQFYCHQLSWIQKLLEYLGISQVRVEGKEGDDVLYQSVCLVEGNKIIVSEDKDFFSLISDTTSIYRPIKKEYVDKNNFSEVSGCRDPIQFMYLKALMGDGSDNIPQVAKGFGDTTALKLLNSIPSDKLSPSEIVRVAAADGSSRMRKLVEVGESKISRNLDLVDISREPFDVFQLQEISETLTNPPRVNLPVAQKIMRSLEFSDKTIFSVLQLADYSPRVSINKNYIRERMQGVI